MDILKSASPDKIPSHNSPLKKTAQESTSVAVVNDDGFDDFDENKLFEEGEKVNLPVKEEVDSSLAGTKRV